MMTAVPNPVGVDVMSSEPRCAVLLLRCRADLARASGEVGAYLSQRHRRAPASAADVVIGIWLDEDGVANLPSALTLPGDGGGARTVRIIETTGINGIWMLCWLDVAAHSVSRVNLVAALLECFGHDATEASTRDIRFIPLFSSEAVETCARAEFRALDARYPGLLLPPGHLDGDGSLCLPDAPAGGGTSL